MELKETIELMTSSDYKDRFKAEYLQLKIRNEKLGVMLEKWRNDKLDFTPSSPMVLFENQYSIQKYLLSILEDRAIIEKILL